MTAYWRRGRHHFPPVSFEKWLVMLVWEIWAICYSHRVWRDQVRLWELNNDKQYAEWEQDLFASTRGSLRRLARG